MAYDSVMVEQDFAAKASSLVHSLETERKIHYTLKKDYGALKERYEEVLSMNQKHEIAI